MSLISLELSDAGVLAAGQLPPRLLAVDGPETESPGFALPQKKGLVVGQSAERQARLQPQKVQHRFWDQLSTDPLKSPRRYAETNAEIAFAHLAQIWEKLKPHGNEVMIAVPAFYSRHQLGLLLGMAQELSIPIKGLVIQAVAAVPQPYPESQLFFLDIHLHRTEVTLLEQGEQLRLQETETLDELGLVHLYRIWAETMAEEFVRTTRFDPLHEAASEQALYDRIPEILNRRRKDPTVTIDLRAGATVHRVALIRDLLVRKSASFLEQARVLVHSLLEKTGRPQDKVTVLMSHRFARLPGASTLMSGFNQTRLLELEIGASALNTLRIWDQFDHPTTGNGAAFFTSRPWQPSNTAGSPQSEPVMSTGGQPTHLLYRDLAYPITEAPLTIGQNDSAADGGLLIGGQSPEAVRHHCSIRRMGEQVVLTAIENQDILIDDQPLTGESTALHLGQSVRLGTSGEIIRLIACLKADDT
ncbi:MAG: hypothetical protein PVG81_03705 [Desulfobacterales bacterium]|jgi:hypothetical protein